MKAELDANEHGRRNRWFPAHILALGLMLLLALIRYVPPTAKGPDVAKDVFSAGRVRHLLKKIVLPETPHPTGSPDHARVRDAVIAEFRALGLEPEVQATFALNGRGSAEQVQNIVVHLRGTEGDDAIALVAHYDSVPAGPGVADDASGVCSILEIARIFTESPPPRNDVVFLITDAEERGLFGARGFVAEHSLMDKIRVVLNWEARGTRGPSFMFETGPDNRGLIRLMSQHCRRSISTSLFPAIYDMLPNDTDLTVFKARGIAGMNFAFIGGAPHYHTSRDNLENLDLGSVQHQGEHFLAMAQALARTRLEDLPQGDAVFFDVLGWFTVSWPQKWNLAIALGAAVLAGFTLLASVPKEERSPRRLVIALAVWPISLSVVALLGAGACQLVIACTGEPVPWWSWAQPMCLVLWCLGIGVPAATWVLIGRRASGIALSAVTTLCWATIGVLLAWYLPGASYLFIVPVAIACVFRLVALRRGVRWEAVNLAFLVTACALWLPLVRGLLDALALRPSFSQTIPLALIGLVIVPSIGDQTRVLRFLLMVAGMGLVGLGTAMIVPTYSEQWPQPVSIYYTQNDEQAIVTVVARMGQLPDRIRRGISGELEDNRPSRIAFRAEKRFAPPTMEVLKVEPCDMGRRLTLRLKRGTGHQRVLLRAGPDFGSNVTVNGHRLQGTPQLLAFDFTEANAAEIELTAPGKLELGITGMGYELPASARALQDKCPAWVTVTTFTLVSTLLEF